MSFQTFDAECSGCKPALVDTQTGEVFPDDNPSMQIVLRLWGATTLAERQAWHRVTCQSSKSPGDLLHARAFAERIEHALKAS